MSESIDIQGVISSQKVGKKVSFYERYDFTLIILNIFP